MTALLNDYWPYVLMLLVGFLPNEVWRMAGLVLSRKIDESSEILIWVRAVANAVLAGVVGKLIIFPSGALLQVSDAVRLSAAGFGVALFFLLRRSIIVGVAGGVIALILGTYFFPM